MKKVELRVSQTSEDYDKAGLDSAVQLAQGKIGQLGLKDFEQASLSFTIGPTEASITMEAVEEPKEESTES